MGETSLIGTGCKHMVHVGVKRASLLQQPVLLRKHRVWRMIWAILKAPDCCLVDVEIGCTLTLHSSQDKYIELFCDEITLVGVIRTPEVQT